MSSVAEQGCQLSRILGRENPTGAPEFSGTRTFNYTHIRIQALTNYDIIKVTLFGRVGQLTQFLAAQQGQEAGMRVNQLDQCQNFKISAEKIASAAFLNTSY